MNRTLTSSAAVQARPNGLYSYTVRGFGLAMCSMGEECFKGTSLHRFDGKKKERKEGNNNNNKNDCVYEFLLF